MDTYKIKKEKFLDWYFSYGSNEENEELRLDLASSVIEAFKNGSNFTIEELFDNINTDLIPLGFIEGFNPSDDTLLEAFDYNLVMVD